MKKISAKGGMETPLSLTFLVISIAVISSGASLLFKEGNDHPAADLRTMQAKDLAECIINQISGRHPFLLESVGSFNSTVIIWTGDEIRSSGEDADIIETLVEVIRFTPDGLWSSTLLYIDERPDANIPGSIVTITERIGPELFIEVILPLKRSPAPCLEVLS